MESGAVRAADEYGGADEYGRQTSMGGRPVCGADEYGG
jgi:hypothetical protein